MVGYGHIGAQLGVLAIGYVVIDLDAEHSAVALAQLRGVKGTIKTRVLF